MLRNCDILNESLSTPFPWQNSTKRQELLQYLLYHATTNPACLAGAEAESYKPPPISFLSMSTVVSRTWPAPGVSSFYILWTSEVHLKEIALEGILKEMLIVRVWCCLRIRWNHMLLCTDVKMSYSPYHFRMLTMGSLAGPIHVLSPLSKSWRQPHESSTLYSASKALNCCS